LLHTYGQQLNNTSFPFSTIEQLNSAVGFYQRVIDHGQKEHVCIACSRGLTDADLPKFKAYVRATIHEKNGRSTFTDSLALLLVQETNRGQPKEDC
jgi:hypothetical protein